MATTAPQVLRFSPRLFLILMTAALLAGTAPAVRAQEPIAPVQRHAITVIGAGHLLQQVFGPMPAV
ncbi:MAG TPA: hypothetical protein VGK45_11405, partial [Thermoanaerobaculia bacterium]